jgi:hypothetical protein
MSDLLAARRPAAVAGNAAAMDRISRATLESRMSRAILLLALSILATASVTAKVISVKPLQTWTGHMPLSVQPLMQSSIANAEDFQRVWATCQLKGAPPAIDFDKRIVLLSVRRGGTVRFTELALENGTLKTTVTVSPDMPNRMTCALVLVDRSGIKTVNGAPLGK